MRLSFVVRLACLAALVLLCQASRLPEHSAQVKDDWKEPEFCRDLQCPPFKQLKDYTEDVEVRDYDAATWVYTNVSSSYFEIALATGLVRLTNYTLGGNLNHTTVDRTNPILVLMYPKKEGRELHKVFTVEGFIPYKMQDDAPEPASDDLHLLDVDRQDVYVKTFGGFATHEKVRTLAFDLMDDLLKDGEDIITEFFGVALYDPPTRFVKRHNEIWIFTSYGNSKK